MVLYGPTGTHGPELTWMIQGKVKADVVARVDPENMMLRDYSKSGLKADYHYIARQVYDAFKLLRDDEDISDWATHMLDPASGYRQIIPISQDEERPDQPDILDQFPGQVDVFQIISEASE